MTVTQVRAAAIGVVAGLVLLLSAVALLQENSRPAEAADAQTAALIAHMNSYRASRGVGPLGTHSTINAATQANAQQNADRCAVGYLTPNPFPGKGWASWNNYGYETADSMWNAWLADPFLLPIIADPSYKSVGVGRARDPECNKGWIWSSGLSTQSGGSVPTNPPTNPPTASPTAQPTPHPTASQSPGPTPTQPPATPSQPPSTTTAAPSASPTPTPTNTPQPTLPVSPTQAPSNTPTPTSTPAPSPTVVRVHGDANCDGRVNSGDAVLILKKAAFIAAFAPCLEASGVDCLGAINTADVLAIFQFMGGIPPHLAPGCPLIGEHILSTPVPTPTTAPTNTPGVTLTPTAVPTPTPAASPPVTPTATTPPPGPGIQHCFLAILSYEVVNAPAFSGIATCSVSAGTAYECDFPAQYNDAYCNPQSAGAPAFECYVYLREWAWCESTSGPDYQCSNNDNGTTLCFPIGASGPEYICALSDAVTCLTEDSAPHFSCNREGQTFTCATLE